MVANLPRPPTKEERAANKVASPFTLLRMLTGMQYLLFCSGWFAWIMDAYDFFSVSLTVSRLTRQFSTATHTYKTHDITQAITLTLLFRSLGALIFGLISDRYGRKWPLVANLVIVAILELGSGFVNTYGEFLAVRSLFGIGMGGIWGLAASTSLENMPVEARGLGSGILQQGYALGYLIAAVINLTLVAHTDNWRTIFWLGAALSLLAAVFRALLPESDVFLRAKAAGNTGNKGKQFVKEIGRALKKHWGRCVFGVLLMTGFNFFSHGSQDLYPTYMQQSKGFSEHQATVATIIGNLGAIVGGTFSGYISQYLGRRLTIICCCVIAACFIPLWILPSKFGSLAAGAFFVQVGVQGAWGVIPVLLQEISPAAFRATWPGVAYQLGNMISSSASQIEATAGDNWRVFVRGADRPDYGRIQAVLIGTVAGYIILLTLFGKEYKGAHFESAKTAVEDGAGLDEPAGNGHRKLSEKRDLEEGEADWTGSEREKNEKDAIEVDELERGGFDGSPEAKDRIRV